MVDHRLDDDFQAPDIRSDQGSEDVRNSRSSLDSIDSSFLGSPSINDDLCRIDSLRPHTRGHRRKPSETSITTSNRLDLADYSSISLGVNNLSVNNVSPLGKNSISELILGVIGPSRGNHLHPSQGRSPTTRDIPPTQLSKIQKVKNSEFKEYMAKMGDEAKRFQAGRALTKSTLEALTAEYSDVSDSGQDELSSVDSIPKIFFSSDFRLDDPRIFQEVTENSVIFVNETARYENNGFVKHLSNNVVLQEKLSWYLDIVEIHLIREISKSAGSFFSALDDLKIISDKASEAASLLKLLDENLEKLDENQASKGLGIMKKIRQRNNTEKLEQSLLQITTIMKQADVAESIFLNGEYHLSLDYIDAVESLIRGLSANDLVKSWCAKWPYPLVNVSALPSLSSLREQISNLRTENGKMFSQLLDSFLLDDLRSHYYRMDVRCVLERLKANNQTGGRRSSLTSSQDDVFAYKNVEAEFESQIKDYVNGLFRCEEMAGAFSEYKLRMVTEVKEIIKEYLPSESSNNQLTSSQVSDRSSSNQGASLSQNLRNMTPREFEDMLINIYTRLSECLRRVTTHQKILLNTSLNSITSGHQRFSGDESDLVMQLDISPTIAKCIEIAQLRMAKIISVRKEQSAQLTLVFFLRFYEVNRLFIIECENISGMTPLDHLQHAIGSQVTLFNSHFHSITMRMMVEKMEKEAWKDTPFSQSVQTLVTEIISDAEDGGNKDWFDILSLQPGEVNGNQNSETQLRKTLTVGECSFIVPTVTKDLLVFLKNYLVLKTVFPHLQNNYEYNVVELLKTFNAKISQAVLGANATKTAGLKHITSKHLAIASQLLDFVIHLIPFVCESFLRTARQNVTITREEFSNVKGLFQDHQNEIFSKLISIMKDRVLQHSKEISMIDWSVPVQAQCHPYMETLVKETSTMSRVLTRYLPEVQFSLILSRIFANYKQVLVESYSQIRFRDSVEKAFMMKDIDYFRDKLVDIMGYGNSGQLIWESVNAMPTDEDVRMEQVMKKNIQQEKTSNGDNSRKSEEEIATIETRDEN